MKLVNLVPLKEIDFRNQDAFDAYNKQHQLRPDTKVTIAGKPTTAGQAAKNSEPEKGSSVFGKDSGGSVFGKTGGASANSNKPEPKKSSNWSFGALSGHANWVAAKSGLRGDYIGTWADENGVDLKKVADAINNNKLKPMDVATAVSGNPGNKYAKSLASKYALEPKDFDTRSKYQQQSPTNDIDGLTSHKDLDKFFKANKDKLDSKYAVDIEDAIGALKYLESDYKRGKADREEVDTAALEIQDLIKKALPKDTPKADVKSIVKGLMKNANKEFAGTYKLKDIADDIEVDTSDNDGKELQARIDKGEDGVYVQTDETEGTVVFNDGSQYQFHHVEDGPIPVTKVGSMKLSEMLPKKLKK